MPKSADHERDQGCHIARHVWTGSTINMTAQEVMNRYVPLLRELQPVARVPPIRVEVAIGKAGDLRKGPEGIFEEDQEDEQECDHEGEEEHTGALGEDKSLVRHGLCTFQTDGRFVEHWDDELFGRDCEEEDTTEDCQRLPKQLHPLGLLRSRIFQLITKSWAKYVIDVVVKSQIFGVGDSTKG